MNPNVTVILGLVSQNNLQKLKVMIVIDVILYTLLTAVTWLVTIIVILFLVYGSEFKRLCLEPALRYPVVIFESDDWG